MWFKFFQFVLAFTFSLTFGAHFAELQLNERLQFREKMPEQTEIIVHIKTLNQLSDQSIQQKVHVLNRHSEVVQWQTFQKMKQP